MIIIYNNKIIAVTNQTNYQYNSSFNSSNKSLTNEGVLNLAGKYIIPGLFDMRAHIAGVRKNSYDQATSENMEGFYIPELPRLEILGALLMRVCI